MQSKRKNTMTENTLSTTEMLDDLEHLLNRRGNLTNIENIPIQQLNLDEEENKEITPPPSYEEENKIIPNINVRGNNNIVIGSQNLSQSTQNFFRTPVESTLYDGYKAHIDVDNPNNSRKGAPIVHQNYFTSPSSRYKQRIAELENQLKQQEDMEGQKCNMACTIL